MVIYVLNEKKNPKDKQFAYKNTKQKVVTNIQSYQLSRIE